jgi:CheY-like chemotaxis protein
VPTILLTDDQVGCSEVVWHLLRDLRCEMLYVEEKSDALARLPEIRPDLIITDLGSPGLDGFSFIQRVRAIDEHVPVVVVSGTLDEQRRTRALRLGASHCLDKPFNVDELREVVRKALGDRGLHVS